MGTRFTSLLPVVAHTRRHDTEKPAVAVPVLIQTWAKMERWRGEHHTLGEWSCNFSMLRNHLVGLFQHGCWPHARIAISQVWAGPEGRVMLPVAGPGTTL